MASYRYLHTRLLSDKELREERGEAEEGGQTGGNAFEG